MTEPLHVHDGDLVPATVVDRPNRFVLRVRFDGAEDGDPERAFLADPGALAVIDPGTTVLCDPADDPERSTDYDAIAVRADGCWVSVRAALANDHVAAVLDRDRLPAFEGYEIRRREPPLPDHGRADFLLETPAGDEAYLEVKSCTHVEDGICKFPDRQTERGRRHLRSLESLVADGTEAHVVFVAQRPDAEVLRPYREVDPEFADLLERVSEAGVGVHAIVVEFDPPAYHLRDIDLPVEFA